MEEANPKNAKATQIGDFGPKIRGLENSKHMVAQVNRKLAHSVLLPLNSVCLVPSRVIQTNQVRPRREGGR